MSSNMNYQPQNMNYQPQETVKYVPVEVEKEVIVKVPKTHYIDRIREVPKYEYVYTDKVVEVPMVKFVERVVDVPEYIEKIKHIPVTKNIEVPVDQITYVQKVEVKVIEKEIEVPGEVITVPKKIEVIEKKSLTKYIDTESHTVVAQTYRPKVLESQDHTQTVKLKKYVPYLVPIQIPCPVAVSRNLHKGPTNEETKPVHLPAAHYNAQVKAMNPNLEEEHLSSLYIKGPNNTVEILGNASGTAEVKPRALRSPQ